MTRSYNLWIHGLILSPMLFNSIVHVACTKKVKKCELKNEKDKSKLNKRISTSVGCSDMSTSMCLCITHKLNRLMKDGTFFSTMCFSYNQKVKFVMYMHLQYTLWKLLRFEDLAFPVWFKPYLIVLSWCSQVPLPKGKVLPLRKQEFLPTEWSPNWQT